MQALLRLHLGRGDPLPTPLPRRSSKGQNCREGGKHEKEVKQARPLAHWIHRRQAMRLQTPLPLLLLPMLSRRVTINKQGQDMKEPRKQQRLSSSSNGKVQEQWLTNRPKRRRRRRRRRRRLLTRSIPAEWSSQSSTSQSPRCLLAPAAMQRHRERLLRRSGRSPRVRWLPKVRLMPAWVVEPGLMAVGRGLVLLLRARRARRPRR